MNSEVHLTA